MVLERTYKCDATTLYLIIQLQMNIMNIIINKGWLKAQNEMMSQPSFYLFICEITTLCQLTPLFA